MDSADYKNNILKEKAEQARSFPAKNIDLDKGNHDFLPPLIGDFVMGSRREEQPSSEWPKRNENPHGKSRNEQLSSFPILSSLSHKMQAVIRLLKALGMAQTGFFFLDWKKRKAWQGWNCACTAVTSEGGRWSPKKCPGVAFFFGQKESVWS